MLYDKYRPQAWDDFIGNAATVAAVRRCLTTLTSGAFWIDGPSGTGKTTLAHLIAREIGSDESDLIEIDGDKCSIECVRDLEQRLGFAPMFGAWNVVIVNEAHAMTNRAVQGWLTLLERLPRRRLILFTTTEVSQRDLFGNFTEPLLSRCVHLSLSTDGLAEAFAERARQIADAEGLPEHPLADYRSLIEANRFNLRATLSAVQIGRFPVPKPAHSPTADPNPSPGSQRVSNGQPGASNQPTDHPNPAKSELIDRARDAIRRHKFAVARRFVNRFERAAGDPTLALTLHSEIESAKMTYGG